MRGHARGRRRGLCTVRVRAQLRGLELDARPRNGRVERRGPARAGGRNERAAMSDPKVRALVTGGSGALGAAICRRLRAPGHFVYVHANRNESAAQEVVRVIRDAGGEALALAFDVTDAEATRAALDRILEEAPIQILVNNGAVHNDAAFAGIS